MINNDPGFDRSAEFRQFSLDLIDDKENIEAKIKLSAQNSSIALHGYRANSFSPPAYLGIPEAVSSLMHNSGLDFMAEKKNGVFHITRVDILPEDSNRISIVDDNGIVVRKAGADETIMPRAALADTAYSLFPDSVRFKLTEEKAIDVITQLSPESSTHYEFQDLSTEFTGQVTVTLSETVDDSIFNLEVTKTIIHPSGKLVSTRMCLTESIQRQLTGQDVKTNAVALDITRNHSPVVQFSMEQIEDGQSIPISLPTKRHIEDVLDVLDRLG